MDFGASSSSSSSSRMSIYKVSRSIKRKENNLFNALRSIYEDSIFVAEISQLWPELPVLANLRCGLWYSRNFYGHCYFKSTDGHTNNWSFNTSRLNLHVALLAGQKGGCMVVDSTRKGKRFPDSMSKTIPIWTCVLNRAILNYRNRELKFSGKDSDDTREDSCGWDSSLHLPLWVSETERALIEDRLEGWTKELEASGADVASLSMSLKKPLRPLWISQRTVIWLNEVPEYDSWDFTPIILISASSSSGNFQHHTTSEYSWNYIAGAGDDEESWARGLTPELFWKHVYDLINSGPDLCNQRVAEIVEKDRVYRTHRGEIAPQISIKSPGCSRNIDKLSVGEIVDLEVQCLNREKMISNNDNSISWLGSTNLAVCATEHAQSMSDAECLLNCDKESLSFCLENQEAYLHLPVVNSKLDRSSLLKSLPSAIDFAKINLRKGKRLLVCCSNGEDISICVCLAILTSLFDDRGQFDDGKFYSNSQVTKLELRKRLVFICKFAVNARPSRGNLKQVFSCLHGGSTTAAA